jgi:hypothetical protein
MAPTRGSAVRRWCTLPLAAGALVVALAPAASVGCNSDPCGSACNNNNRLGCAGTCDCTACSTAPPSCRDFFDCVASQTTCTDIFFNCAEPSECATYVSQHCQ